MSLLKMMLSIRTKRSLEWRILGILSVLSALIIVSIVLKFVYIIPNGEDYDYFYFEDDSLELFGENESEERLVKKFPAVVKKRHNDKLDLPVIFIAGYPWSGSKVVVKLIEHYANVTCNRPTNVISQFLKMADVWNETSKERLRLKEAKIEENLLFEIKSGFIRDIVYGQNVNSQSLICVEEHEAYIRGLLLQEYFPMSKFIFVVRDGRAAVPAYLKPRQADYKRPIDHENEFIRWSTAIDKLVNACTTLGPETCLILRYEDMKLSPGDALDTLFYFLGMISKLPLERSSSAIQNASSAFDYASEQEPVDPEILKRASIISGTLQLLGYELKLEVAGTSEPGFDF